MHCQPIGKLCISHVPSPRTADRALPGKELRVQHKPGDTERKTEFLVAHTLRQLKVTLCG